MDTETTGKTWYQKAQDRGTNVSTLLLLVAVGFGFFKALPFLIAAVENTIYLGVLCGVAGLMALCVLDGDFRTPIWLAWKNATRALTRTLVNYDPIGTIETCLKEMEKRLNEMLSSKNALGGQIKKLDMTIEGNQAKADKDLRLAQAADQKGDKMQAATFAMEAQQLKVSNDNLNATRTKMELMFRTLDRMYVNTNFILTNTKNQVAIKKLERDAVMEGHKAMTSGWRVIKGDSASKALFDQGMESIADTMSKQLSEMESIMDLSSDMMNGVDLEKGLLKEDALKMLDKWEKEGQSSLLGTDKNVLISQAYDPTHVLDMSNSSQPMAAAVLTAKKERFANLLK